MIFLGLCNNNTVSGEHILTAAKLEKVGEFDSSPVDYQCEIAVPILYAEASEETCDATTQWLVTLFEKVGENILKQTQELNPHHDVGGFHAYVEEAVKGIKIIAPEALGGKDEFAPFIRNDSVAKPKPGDNLIIVKLAYAIQRRDTDVTQQPNQPGFLTAFVAFEYWKRNKSDINKLEFVGLLKGSWEV